MWLRNLLGTKVSALPVLCILGGWGVASLADEKSLYKVVIAEPSMLWALEIQRSATAIDLSIKNPAYSVSRAEMGFAIDLPGVSAWTDPGQPRLPIFAVLIELSDLAKYDVTYDPGVPVDIELGYLAPVIHRQSVSYSDTEYGIEEVFIPDPEIYARDAFWPEKHVHSSEARGMGRRYLRISLHSFHYNPVTQMLRFYPDLKVAVQFAPLPGGEG